MRRLLTADEVADILNVDRARVYELAARNILPPVRIGRQLRWDPEVVERFIAQGGKGLESDEPLEFAQRPTRVN